VGWRVGIAQHGGRRRRHRDRLHAPRPRRERLVGPGQLQRDDWRADDHLRRRHARIQPRSTRPANPFDDHFHGNARLRHHRAVGNNGVGVAGVNWFASIMGLKFLNQNGAGNVAGAINAIEFAVQAKAAFPGGGANVRVLSNSWAAETSRSRCSTKSTAPTRATCCLWRRRETSASDNDTAPTYPASYAAPNVVAVRGDQQSGRARELLELRRDAQSIWERQAFRVSPRSRRRLCVLQRDVDGNAACVRAAALLLSRLQREHGRPQIPAAGQRRAIPSLSAATLTGGRLNLARAIGACGRPGNTSPSVTLTDPVGRDHLFDLGEHHGPRGRVR
jgi:hypothetical protein